MARAYGISRQTLYTYLPAAPAAVAAKPAGAGQQHIVDLNTVIAGQD